MLVLDRVSTIGDWARLFFPLPYLGLQSGYLNSIGNKEGCSTFLNLDDISECNDELSNESY